MKPGDVSERKSSRDVAAILTHRVLAMALDELRSEETRAYVSEHLVRPLIRAVVAESMPYAIAFTTVIIAILLMSALTLTLLTFSLQRSSK
jgi:hypothetical protein